MKTPDRCAVVLLSGGLHSTIALCWALREFDEVLPVVVDYGQRNQRKVSAAFDVCARSGGRMKLRTPIKQNLPDLFAASHSTMLQHDQPISSYPSLDAVPPNRYDSTTILGKHLALIGVAMSWMQFMPAHNLVLGLSADHAMSSLVMSQVGDIVKATCGRDYALRAPLMLRSGAAVVELAGDVGALVPLTYSHTCYHDQPKPCRHCRACLKREAAFILARVPDPLLSLHGVEAHTYMGA